MTRQGTPRPEWLDATCVVCPAQRLGLGCFDVVDSPGPRYRFDREVGYRVDTVTDAAVCVHPFRVGLAPGAYATAGIEVRSVSEGAVFDPSADQLNLPSDLDDLEAWFVAVLRVAEPNQMASALDHAQAVAAERFEVGEIVGALRRVLAHELPR